VSASIGTWNEKEGKKDMEQRGDGLQLLAEVFRFAQLYHGALLAKRQLVAQKTFSTQQRGRLPFLPACTAGGLHKQQGRERRPVGASAPPKSCETTACVLKLTAHAADWLTELRRNF